MSKNAKEKAISLEIELKNVCDTEKSTLQMKSTRCTFKDKLYRLIRSSLWAFPLLTSLVIFVFVAVVYTSALVQGHVEPFLPYISDAGTVGFQAGLFTQLLNTISILMILVAFIRYKQLKYCFKVKLPHVNEQLSHLTVHHHLNNVNFVAYLTLVTCGSALTLPANFRSSEWAVLHTVGASIAAVTIHVYMWLMVYMCNCLAKSGIESKPVTMTIFTFFGTISALCCSIFSLISFGANDKFLDSQFRLYWNQQDAGYLCHILATTTEWLLLNMFAFFLFCLTWRMKQFSDWNAICFSQ